MTIRRFYLALCTFALMTCSAIAQNIPQAIEYTEIYDFIEELQCDGIIQANTAPLFVFALPLLYEVRLTHFLPSGQSPSSPQSPHPVPLNGRTAVRPLKRSLRSSSL